MNKQDLIICLKDFYEEIKSLQTLIANDKSVQVTKAKDKSILNSVSERWFQVFQKVLIEYGVSAETIEAYNKSFKEILSLSSSNSRRSSYSKHISFIYTSFNKDILIFIQTESDIIIKDRQSLDPSIQALLNKISNQSENEYLAEAIGCFNNNYMKAATVLIWCATIDRIHKVIEKSGFSIFNNTSRTMKSETTGRFKRFNKEYNIRSLSELRTVFDSDILSVLEGMQLIDINQRVRLTSCFEMRCHSGHPGDAPITKYNVISCLSDVVEIVFTNPKFNI